MKSRFVKSKLSIYVSQMYFPAVTKLQNNTLIARKELKRLDLSIQAFVIYPAKLMVRKAAESKYRVHGEY